MIIIGEKLNSNDETIKKYLLERNDKELLSVAQAQINGGADYFDINCSSLMESEESALIYLINLLQTKYCDIGICISSANMDIISNVLHKLDLIAPIINSADSVESARKIADIARRTNALVVVTPLTNDKEIDKKIIKAQEIVSELSLLVSRDRIYVDCMVQKAIAETGHNAMELLKQITAKIDDVGTIATISNTSLQPNRSVLNCALLTVMSPILDMAIVDPTDEKMSYTIAEIAKMEDEQC